MNPEDLVKEQSRDADKWARAFTQDIKEKGLKFPTEESCIEHMRGWFANAMMAMHDSVLNNECEKEKLKKEKLESLILMVDPAVSDREVTQLNLDMYQSYIKDFPDEHPIDDPDKAIKEIEEQHEKLSLV